MTGLAPRVVVVHRRTELEELIRPTGFYRAKLATARFFMERTLPETAAHLARITAGADTTMALDAEQF